MFICITDKAMKLFSCVMVLDVVPALLWLENSLAIFALHVFATLVVVCTVAGQHFTNPSSKTDHLWIVGPAYSDQDSTSWLQQLCFADKT